MEKTIKEVVEKSHNAYKGKFWNRHIREFQTWEAHMKWLNDFESFCSRMWLDNEEENLSPHASGNRLSKSKYIETYEDWLVKKFVTKQMVDRSII